jgi:hypothetical protein
MPSIAIRDLSRSTELDHDAMGAVRGGFSFGPDAKINLSVNQQIFQVQDIDVNVLNNNGSIGAGFVGPHIDVDALQKGENKAFFPKFV